LEQIRPQPLRARRPVADRLAGAPISWGACEVPGWGVMPEPGTVLAEMAALGLRGTELGPPGFFAPRASTVRAALDRHGLAFVGAFTPLVLHERTLHRSANSLREMIELLADAGGEMLVVAAVQDPEWSRPEALDDAGWRRLAEHAAQVKALAAERGLTFALHPHIGTLVETEAQVNRALDELDPAIGWCLDTGHLLIGGTDPARFAAEHGQRVTHVHLKDVDGAVAADLRAGRLTHLEATRRGVFRPLGHGDAAVRDVLEALDGHGYGGWLVLEQDTAIAADEPAANGGPRRDAAQSIAFINEAQTEERER
jgi:inosose dehydratase